LEEQMSDSEQMWKLMQLQELKRQGKKPKHSGMDFAITFGRRENKWW
jgi:hypothetical protein